MGPTKITATFVNNGGEIIKHTDDDDDNIYLVTDDDWDGSKKGLTVIGKERKGREYKVGEEVAFGDLSGPGIKAILAANGHDVNYNSMTEEWEMLFLASDVALMSSGSGAFPSSQRTRARTTTRVTPRGLGAQNFQQQGNQLRRKLGIPDNWVMKPTKKGGGVRFIDPNNPNNNVRVMPGNPESAFANSRQPYVIRYKNGAPVDKNGNAIPSSTGANQNRSPDLHVPLTEFKFK